MKQTKQWNVTGARNAGKTLTSGTWWGPSLFFYPLFDPFVVSGDFCFCHSKRNMTVRKGRIKRSTNVKHDMPLAKDILLGKKVPLCVCVRHCSSQVFDISKKTNKQTRIPRSTG
jgi:hypothetical protein